MRECCQKGELGSGVGMLSVWLKNVFIVVILLWVSFLLVMSVNLFLHFATELINMHAIQYFLHSFKKKKFLKLYLCSLSLCWLQDSQSGH